MSKKFLSVHFHATNAKQFRLVPRVERGLPNELFWFWLWWRGWFYR